MADGRQKIIRVVGLVRQTQKWGGAKNRLKFRDLFQSNRVQVCYTWRLRVSRRYSFCPGAIKRLQNTTHIVHFMILDILKPTESSKD